MHWGGGSAAQVPSASSVWTGYVGVWHMNAANGAAGTAEPDATGHGLDAVPSCRQPDGENNLAQMKTIPNGKVGRACQNQGYADSNAAVLGSRERSDHVHRRRMVQHRLVQ